MPDITDDVWELYGPDDCTRAHDLAPEQPDKLAELQRLFLIEAARFNVLPLVQIYLAEAAQDDDHLISPEEGLCVAMARQ